MVANDARVPLCVGNDGYAVAYAQSFLRDDFVRDKSRDGVIGAGNFAEQLRSCVVVERSRIRHLSAGLGVNHGAVEHHFPDFARFQLVDWPATCVRIASIRASLADVP